MMSGDDQMREVVGLECNRSGFRFLMEGLVVGWWEQGFERATCTISEVIAAKSNAHWPTKIHIC
jgi:hypothetical protein